MRRFFTLICLLCLAIPAGISLSGCTRNPAANYCNLDGITGYGPTVSQVYSITLNPQIAGISLAYGQTTQIQQPQAYTCKGLSANVTNFAYGTTNNQLVDLSPTGSICAGTWNRNTGGGIADYTYCNFPNPLPSTNGLPYGIAYITAAAASVTSNPVEVYIHAPVTSISLVGPQECLSQGQTAQLDAQGCYSQNGKQVLLCAPASITSSTTPNLACPLPYVNGVSGAQVPLSSIPSCGSSIGTLSFGVSSGSGSTPIASINPTTNEITAEQPGTVAITASIANSGSSAGFFSTCPVSSIAVTLANGSTAGTVTQGVQQDLTTTVYDTNNNIITGLSLNYESTNPVDTSVGSGGAITTNYPGVASVFAVCQPSVCNPAPINVTGTYGTGLSIASNPVNITTPGTASDFLWYGAPGQSQYFGSIELLTGVPGASARLPYVPNSMFMDQGGNNLYFGSARELMEYNTSGNAPTKVDSAVPGVILAVAPDNSQLLINDQARHLFYVYNIASGGAVTFPGMGNAAAWTQDVNTLYITDNSALNTPAGCSLQQTITGHTDTLYVYNGNTGWSTYPLPPSPLPTNVTVNCEAPNSAPSILLNGPNTVYAITNQTPAITVPSVGAYLRGAPNTSPGATPQTTGTVAHTWCPSGVVGSPLSYYPLGDSEPIQSDALASTFDGKHILGAEWLGGGGIELSDVGISIPSTTINGISLPKACPSTIVGTTQTLDPLLITGTVNQVTFSAVSASSVNQVVTGSLEAIGTQPEISNLAFITYTGNGTGAATLPYYLPSTTGGAGTHGYVTFCQNLSTPNCSAGTPATSPTAPLAGAFSPDNSLFFVSTAGDNAIHYISIPPTIAPSTPLVDKQQINPDLPACVPVSAGGVDAGCIYNNGGTVAPATVITVKPRTTT